MSVAQSFEVILNRMLRQVPDRFDKREGSVIYDALAPGAMELANMYLQLDILYDESFADTASYYYLAKRAAERGIFPKMATQAVLEGEFKPETAEIPYGARFNLGQMNYIAGDKIDSGKYELTCETAGAVGNQYFGKLLPIEYINGLQYGEITAVLIPGEDLEDVEAFRKRYFASLNSEAYGGNIADYQEKVLAIEGVGGVKVYPVWNGGGTVRLVIIDSGFNPPSETLVGAVQERLDPEPNRGEGYGIAPIGHVVTVAGVATATIDVSATFVFANGWTWADAVPYVEGLIDGYFSELASNWADLDSIIVRISQIESRILTIPNVVDVFDTTINAQGQNLVLGADEVPVRGVVHSV